MPALIIGLSVLGILSVVCTCIILAMAYVITGTTFEPIEATHVEGDE